MHKIEIHKVQMVDEKSCEAMYSFLKMANEELKKAGQRAIEVIPCDDLLIGEKGYLAFMMTNPKEELSVYFCWKFSEPVRNHVNMWTGDNADVLLRECLDPANGWVRHDEPKALKIGYIHYGKSEWRHLKIKDLRMLDKEILELFGESEKERIKGWSKGDGK